MRYESVTLEESIRVERLYTIHYFEYTNKFAFKGEAHAFWEFCYVDKGEVDIASGSHTSALKSGEIVFHKPDEFHSVRANGTTAPNLVVISFDCASPEMQFFNDRTLHVDETERNLLANIIIEARRCFSCRLDDPYLMKMSKKKSDVFGAEQMIKLQLEQLLIHLIRRYSNPIVLEQKTPRQAPKLTKSKNDSAVFGRVVDYLEENLTSHITIADICQANLVGRSQLQKIFHEKSGLGIIEYFSKMKIDAAKQLIRASSLNFTQISEQLGYTSVHYFSRQFKKITGMTPSEYSSSVKAMDEEEL